MSSRLVVIGRNSKLWGRLERRVQERAPDIVAIGNSDVTGFVFQPGDMIWIFSYSRKQAENEAMLKRIGEAAGGKYFYVSTATANVASVTNCYGYPRIKAAAEKRALASGSRVVRIGLIHDDRSELPGGCSAATLLDDIAAEMMASLQPGPIQVGTVHLYSLIDCPFSGVVERRAFVAYSRAIKAMGRWPCLLRPLDMLLARLGWRWYGYLNISNQLCISTTS